MSNVIPKNHPLIDANINRFKEGTRVLEDIARFILQDENLFLAIKTLKHAIKVNPIVRHHDKDIGGIDFKEAQSRTSIVDLINANAVRMQEALRVLEECDNRLFYKDLRFKAYDLHSKMLIKLKYHLKLDKLKGIYAICDPQKHPLTSIANIVNEGNISICQIRMKTADKKTIYNTTQQMRALLNPEETCLIINDHLDIALACADGVHLGQNDFPIENLRDWVPIDFIVGVTCHSVIEAVTAKKAGANYISVGCLYPTQTKQDVIPTSLEMLQQIMSTIDLPICVIGGIDEEHFSYLKRLNIDMIAMHSALWENPNPLEIIEVFNRV